MPVKVWNTSGFHEHHGELFYVSGEGMDAFRFDFVCNAA
jgi:hypothetical protein